MADTNYWGTPETGGTITPKINVFGIGVSKTNNFGWGYLIRDEFTTPATDLNGTAVEPGPGGTRAETDTAARFSTSGGNLVGTSFAGGAWNDPRVTLSTSISRVPGRCARFEITPQASAAGNLWFGFFTANPITDATCNNAFFVHTTSSSWLSQLGSERLAPLILEAVECVVVLRTSGAQYFFKSATEGGVYKLLGETQLSTLNGTPLYVGVMSSGQAYSLDRVSVPTKLQPLAIPVASDSFNETGVGYGILSFTIDDNTSLADAKILAGIAETYGYTISLGISPDFPDIPGYSSPLTAGDWTDLQDLNDAGHDICSHSSSHGDLTVLTGFTIRYVGAGSACSMTIGSDTLTTTVTGGGGGEDLNLDLTNASYDRLQEIVNYIDGLAGYTCSRNNFTYRTKSTCLADVSGQDIRTASYDVLLNQTKYFSYEITDSITLLEAGISGYSCKSLIYPWGNSNAASRTAVKNAGFIGARLALGDKIDLLSLTDIFQITTSSPTTAFGNPPNAGTINNFLDGLNPGYIHTIMAHDFVSDGYDATEWATVFSTIAAYQAANPGKIQIKNLSESLQYVFDNSVTADNIKYYLSFPLGNTDGQGHLETSGLGAGGSGMPWVDAVGTHRVFKSGDGDWGSTPRTVVGGVGITTIDVGVADVLITAVISIGTNKKVGIVVRYVDSSNYVYVEINRTTGLCSLRKVVAGVDSSVFSTAVTYVYNKELRVLANGTSFVVYYNTAVVNSGTISDAVLQTGTKVGMIQFEPVASIWNSFRCYAVGSDGRYVFSFV